MHYVMLIILSIQLRWRWKFCFFKSWTIKKAEPPKIDAFELWCWKRLLRIPWVQPVNPEGDQSWIFIGRTMLKLKLQYFGHLMRRVNSLENSLQPWGRERLKAGGEGDNRGLDGWMASPTQWVWVWVKSRSWWWTGRPGVLQSMGSQRVRHNWVTWTEMKNWVGELGPIYCHFLGEGNGNPLQYSCLENPMDGGAW